MIPPAFPGDPFPYVVCVPGPVETATRVDSLAALRVLVAEDPEHPIHKFVEHFIRNYPANVVPYVLVLPESDWFRDGKLHPSVRS